MSKRKFTAEEVRKGLNKAADWLEANPDRHIHGDIAKDKDGVAVPPTVKAAECFCALGRLANELKIVSRKDDSKTLDNWPAGLTDALAVVNSGEDVIYSVNDRKTSFREMFCSVVSPGNPAVIAFMRDIANGTN